MWTWISDQLLIDLMGKLIERFGLSLDMLHF